MRIQIIVEEAEIVAAIAEHLRAKGFQHKTLELTHSEERRNDGHSFKYFARVEADQSSDLTGEDGGE